MTHIPASQVPQLQQSLFWLHAGLSACEGVGMQQALVPAGPFGQLKPAQQTASVSQL
jgi:hypothetical protein